MKKKLTCTKCGREVDFLYSDNTCSDCKMGYTHKERSRVPKMYANAQHRCNPDELNKYHNLIFWGNFGNGKTETAYAHLLATGEGLYHSASSLTIYVKAGFEHRDTEYRIEKLKQTPLLIIDEYDKLHQSEFNETYVYEIIRARDAEMLQTILICNARDKAELKDKLSNAVKDRYRRGLIEFTGASRR